MLKTHILRNAGKSGIFPGKIPELRYHRHDEPEMPVRHFMEPVLIIIVQGAKSVQVGNEKRAYPAGTYFLSAIDMPVTSCVLEASQSSPYLSLSLELDMNIVATLAAKSQTAAHGENAHVMGATGHEIDIELLDALVRLTEITQKPDDMACLKAGALEEIHYRLLKGGAGETLYSLCALNVPVPRIRNIIAWVRENYRKPFTIRELAENFALAPSTLHKHFRSVTSLSPIQYQKMLRLCEANRMLKSREARIGDIAELLGYKSATQFSREYKRFYGVPPVRDRNSA